MRVSNNYVNRTKRLKDNVTNYNGNELLSSLSSLSSLSLYNIPALAQSEEQLTVEVKQNSYQ